MTISSLLESKVRAATASLGATEVKVQSANDTRFGDYQTNIAMVLAKQQKANPRQLAQQIIDQLDVADMCTTPEIAGAGFINFRLKPEWLAKHFTAFLDDARLGVPEPAKVKTLVIDFSSPNVAKPMHVGHIRSTFLGDALSRIAEFIGHKVVRDNHIGDWGTQFGMLIYGWKHLLDREALDRDAITELERIYKAVTKLGEPEREAKAKWLKETIVPQLPHHTEPVSDEQLLAVERANPKPPEPIGDACRHELVKLQNGDSENLLLWQEMIRLSQVQFDNVYTRLGVRFDVTYGESFYNPQLKDVVTQLRERGIATESEGAWCVFSDKTGKPEEDPFLIKDKEGWRDNPALVQKSDGASNYTTTDLATLEYRIKTWAPDEIVYITDGRQQLHFRQLFAIFRRWHTELAATVRLAHVWFGAILGDDGKPFKTRTGDTVKLVDLLDEAEERAFALVTEKNPEASEADRREIARVVGLGAVKYADLLPNRQGDYVFSWAKMLSFQGNTAPYLQYSYVRVRSIFRKGEELGALSEHKGEVALAEAAELALAKKVLQFGEVLPQVLEDYRPNVLANYLYELASLFHSFFESCPVLKSEGATRSSRLALCDATARVLKQGLGLLGIEAPERM